VSSALDDDSLWPPLDEALIKKLEQVLPERCPDLVDSDREIWLYAGQRQVVRMLRAVYLEQQDEA
jgi:hypothetical protein